MRSVYPKFAEQRLRGAAGLEDLAAVTIKALAIDASLYTFSGAHQFLSDIPILARMDVSQALGAKTFTDGNLDMVDPIFTFAPGITVPVTAVGLFIDTGDPATSRLMFFSDEEAGLPMLPPSAGGTRTWKLPTGGPFRL